VTRAAVPCHRGRSTRFIVLFEVTQRLAVVINSSCARQPAQIALCNVNG